jgi:hypothetical protein
MKSDAAIRALRRILPVIAFDREALAELRLLRELDRKERK